MLRRWRHALVLWLLASGLSVALAQSPAGPDEAAKAAASTHFRRGVELFEEEAFRSALVEFQRAYDLAPDYRVLYNIGQTQLRIQDYLGAIRSYERYLSDGHDAIAPERRAQVEQTIVSLRGRVGSVQVSVNRAGADVFLDELKVGTSPLPAPLSANVGRYRVMARAPDGSTDTRMVDIVGGESASVALVLDATGAQADAVNGASRRSPRRTLAVASWSVAAVVLAGSAATGLLAVGAHNDLERLLKQADVSHREVSDKRQAVHSLALTTDILIGTGAAAAVLGTLLWVLDRGEARPAQARRRARPATRAAVSFGVGLGSFSLHGRY